MQGLTRPMLSTGSRSVRIPSTPATLIRRTAYYLLGVITGLIPLVILFMASAPPPPFFLPVLALHFDTIMFGIVLLAIVVLVLQPRGHWSREVAWGIITAAVLAVSALYALTTAIPF